MSTIQIDRLLETTIKKGASDLHISVGRPPVLRLNGGLRDLATKVLEPDDTIALMKSITPDRSQQELQEVGSADFGFAFASADGQARARFRVSVFRQKGHIGIVMRKIPYKLLTFDQIGLPGAVEELCRRPRGLFLVTGPTGSGKTTTLASMINYINLNFDRHIITAEDPLEYYHEHKKSIITQREIGGDVPTFAEALRRALRQDPDVVMVGEMRDLETIGRLAKRVGLSPPSICSFKTPAAMRASLYLPMASIIFGSGGTPSSLSFVALTKTMTFIEYLQVGGGFCSKDVRAVRLPTIGRKMFPSCRFGR
jgi:twitching motility protein PilT